MTKYLYLEGANGISGDMLVAALLDLTNGKDKLDKVLQALPINGFNYQISRKNSYSISGCDFDVKLEHEEHHHEEEYSEEHHHHHHEHRHLSDVNQIIDQANISVTATNLAKKIFFIVAEAEAKAHGCSIETVHFHEVGAIDSIIDIISIAVLFDELGIDNVIVNGLSDGHGFVKCQHGTLPVPVPAVINIAEKYAIALRPTDNNGEMVTPTGIAAVAALKTSEELPSCYKILKTGIGLGKRDFGHANFLRTMILEDKAAENQIYVLETNIDDSTPEELGLTMEKLFIKGAADVHFEPCFMKKNRPAYLLRVIASADKISDMEKIIFYNTSSIGIRKYPVERRCMDRHIIDVETPYGTVQVKKCHIDDIVRYNPEYESVKNIAAQANKTFREVFDSARYLAMEKHHD